MHTTPASVRAGKQRIYGNSYEARHIELVRTALAHLAQAGA